MADRVYRWKAPELTITVTAGGSLQANKTYYVFGYLCYYSWVMVDSYHIAHSPIQACKTFQTTDTNKSISVAWKTTGSITSFESGGTGKIKVNSSKHCLDTGNTIIIESGAYAGAYSITWNDYDSFLINGTFSSSYESTWRCEILPNKATSIKLYMHTENPFDADNIFIGANNKFSHSFIQQGYTSNPFSVTAEYNTPSPTINHWSGFLYRLKQYNDLTWIYGKGIICIDTATPSIDLIQTMLQQSGMDTVNIIADKLLKFTSHIYIPQTDEVILTNYNFLLEDALLRWSTMILYHGIIISLKILSFGYISCKLRYSTVFADAFCNEIPNIISGTKNRFQLAINTTSSSIILQDIDFISPITSQISYITIGYLERCNFIGSYIYFAWKQTTGSTRPLRNCRIEAGNYDMLFYSYQANNMQIEFENVDTLRTNNLKVLWAASGNYAYQSTYTFYRKVNFTIKDNSDNAIADANIKVTDNLSNEYNFTSDASGNVTIEVIEQTTVLPVSGYGTNTLYTDFEVEIGKEGYMTEKMYYSLGKDISDDLADSSIVLAGIPVGIESLSFTHPTIANNDGEISILANFGTAPYQYSIDNGINWQESDEFTSLAEGEYNIVVKDAGDNIINGIIISLKKTEIVNLEITGIIEEVDEIEGIIELCD